MRLGRFVSSQLLKCEQYITSGHNLRMHMSAHKKRADQMAARDALCVLCLRQRPIFAGDVCRSRTDPVHRWHQGRETRAQGRR